MKKITQKEINDAAKEHAKDVLGSQFKTNPEEVKSISEDFKAGIKWFKKELVQ